MPRRPKHYDRPGKRPGPPRGPNGGGSVIDQRGKADERDQLDPPEADEEWFKGASLRLPGDW